MPRTRPGLLIGTSLLLTLAGCSGTPFGDQLASSFSNPGTPAPSPTPAAPASPASPTKSSPAPASSSGAAKAPPAPPPAKRPAQATSLQPAPYRVTIKLPAADPSAPAEMVTQALRAAGVSFEVEMIERVLSNSTAAPQGTATPTPAPAPAPTAAPR